MNLHPYTIRYAEDSDEQRWDRYVISAKDFSPYHLFAWKKAVEEAYHHKGYYILAEKDQHIAGVLPAVHIRLPFLVNEISALPFCDVGNMLCENERVSTLLLFELFELQKRLRTPTISLRDKRDIPTPFSKKLHACKTDKVRMFLDLPESSRILLTDFRSKLRSQIRKAEKNGLLFRWGSLEDLDDYYRVFSINMRDLGSPVHSKNWFASILTHYGERARMGLITFDGKAVGCCIALSGGDRIAMPWASTLRRYNHLAPNMLLYWNMLKFAADNNFSRFDLGRSSVGEGTYMFKKQWGAKPAPLVWYANGNTTLSSKPTAEDSHGGSRKRIARLWACLPGPIANRVGPHLRRYISL